MKKTVKKTEPGNNETQETGGEEIRPEYNPAMIRDNCDKIENNFSYLHELTAAEIKRETENLVDLSVRLADLDKEKRDLLTEIKSRIDPTKNELKNSVETVRTGKKYISDPEVYIFYNRKKKKADIYNASGVYVLTRDMSPEEIQTIDFNETANR